MVRKLYQFLFYFISQTVIFQNESDRKELIKQNNYKNTRTLVIPGSGVDTKVFHELEISNKKVVVLIGRIIKEKGVETFINMANIVKAKREDIDFVLVGPIDFGNPSSINEKYIRYWESMNIIEWLSDVDDIIEVYKNASIVTLPSYREGLPKVLLEAGLCCRPVIATDVAGCNDVIKDGLNGYLFPLDNSNIFAEKVLELIDDKEKMLTMGKKGRELVLRNFSSEIVIPQIVEAIKGSIKYE